MTKPYSLDLRDRVVAAVETEGMSRNKAAARFGVAVSTAVHWVRRYRATGNVSPSKIGGYKKRILRGEHADWLIARCREKDFTISLLVEELLAIRGVKVDRHSVWEFLHAEGLSFKKRMARPVCKGDLGWLKRSASTYPVSGTSPGQDGYPRVPGPHKNFGVEHHILNQDLRVAGWTVRPSVAHLHRLL